MANLAKAAADRMARATLYVERHQGNSVPGFIPPVGTGIPHSIYTELQGALTAGSSVSAKIVKRNSGDNGWETGDNTITVYAPPDVTGGGEWESGVIVLARYQIDPAFPHWVVVGPPPARYVKLTSSLSPGDSAGAVFVKRNSGDAGWADTTDTVTVYAPPLMRAEDSFDSGVYGLARFHQDGAHPHWVLDNAACPQEGS